MNKRKRAALSTFSLVLLLALTTVVLSACNTSESTTQQPGSSSTRENSEGQSSSPSSVTNGDNSSEPIVVYANDFVDVIGDMFTEATGYAIEIVHGGGGEVLSRVEAEQGNPQWDVIWLDGHASLYGLADRGFFLEGWEPENLSYLNEQGRSLLHPNLSYFPTGVHAAATLVYNTNLIGPADAPQTWDDFFNLDLPIAIADPGVAAPAYPVVSWFFYEMGIEQAEETFDRLFSEKNLHVYPKNGPVGNAVATGEVAAAALQEHNAYALKLAGEPIEMVWPSDGAPGSVRVAAIGKHTKNLEVAQAFIEFLLDPSTQSKLTALEDDTDGFFTPLAEGVPANPERKENPHIVLPDVEWASKHEAQIKQWFADRAVQ